MSEHPEKRIVSLVPSLTELLYDLGLDEQIVGRTRFCIHPEDQVTGAAIIGGTKNPNIEKILKLDPDLVIANKEENRKEDIDQIRSHTEVLLTEIETPEDAIIEIMRIGEATGTENKADQMVNEIRDLLPDKKEFEELSAAYFIWKDPWMTVGCDTYIHHIMERFGLKNVYGDRLRYPKTDLHELKGLSPELILLSSEPYPFKQKHIPELKQKLPGSVIKVADGEWFSWYGSRMISALAKLREWRKNIESEKE